MTERESTSGEPATAPAAHPGPDEPAVPPADVRPDEPSSPGPAADARPDEPAVPVTADARPDEPGLPSPAAAGEPTAGATADEPSGAEPPVAETEPGEASPVAADGTSAAEPGSPAAETTAGEPSGAEPPVAETEPGDTSPVAADGTSAAEPGSPGPGADVRPDEPSSPGPASAEGEPAAETTANETAGAEPPVAEPVAVDGSAVAADGTPAVEPAGTPETPLAGEPVGGGGPAGEGMAGVGRGDAWDAATERVPGAEQDGDAGDAATERTPAGGATAWAPGGGAPPGAGPGGATAAGFPAGAVPPSGGAWSAFTGRRLARSSQRKVIAGVAGGLGEYTGIDPVLFRVLFAVLTLFGGSGILLYVVAWLFMPADDEQSSPVESLLHRGPGGSNRTRDAAAAGALVIAGLVLAGVLALGDARDLALVLVVVGGAFFLVRNLQERRDGGPPQPAVPEPAPPPPAPYETPLPTYQPQPAYQPPPPYPPVQHTAPTVTLPPAPPPPPREHSALGMITVSLLLVVLGVAAALTAAGAIDPEADDLLAVAVGTIGAGLLVGAWFGRARWLTWLGIPLLIALIVVSASNVSLKGGVGDRRYDPQTAAQVESEYRIGVGSIRLDLSDVDFSEQLVRTKVSAGVGNIEVIVPRTTDVVIDGRAGIGEVDLLGQVANGTSASRSVVDHGPGGDGTIDLRLDLDVSIGRVEVDRAAS